MALPTSPASFFTDLHDVGDRPNRRALGDWVLLRLYEGIFGSEFPPGEPLVEADLTRVLGVSRQPIREALRQLQRDGLIAEAKGNGQRTVVAYRRHHLVELYGIRAALESVSFEAATPVITHQQLAVLEELQDQMRRRMTSDSGRPGRFDPTLDFRFHEVVCLASGMRTLHAHLSTIWLQTWALLTQLDLAGTYPATADIEASYADRQLLIEALRGDDPANAGAVARAHVCHRRDQLLAAIDAGRGGFRLNESQALEHPAGAYV
jgi:DNA-binding GntR family transcriptional regulator